MLPGLYIELKDERSKQFQWEGEGEVGALSSDGWKRKAAGQATPLVNFNLLSPNGGSMFLEILTARGVIKNAQWICDRHIEMANKVTNNQPKRCLPVCCSCWSPCAQPNA